ncbi:MAG: ATP-binding protein [Bacteroidota bacterium]
MDTATDPQSKIFLISLIGLIVMLLLAIVVVLFYVYYQRRLFEQQRELGDLRIQQQQDLLAATINSQEKERRRIAADLHDGIGVLLTTSQLFIRQIPATEEALEHRDTSLQLIDESITNIRSITHNLSPENLLQFGLCAALEDLVKVTNQLPGLQLNFQHDEYRALNREKEFALYRIVQELFNNCIKHAQAQTIDLSLLLQSNPHQLMYRDDGKGMDLGLFSVPSTEAEGGIGLKNIRSRAQFLQAEMKLKSQPGQGLYLQLSFP